MDKVRENDRVNLNLSCTVYRCFVTGCINNGKQGGSQHVCELAKCCFGRNLKMSNHSRFYFYPTVDDMKQPSKPSTTCWFFYISRKICFLFHAHLHEVSLSVVGYSLQLYGHSPIFHWMESYIQRNPVLLKPFKALKKIDNLLFSAPR